MDSIARFADEIEARKQRIFEKRILAYVTKVCRNNPYCCVSQVRMARGMRIRTQTVGIVLKRLVEAGKLIRVETENGKRKNKKHHYFLPVREPLGKPNKESISYPLSRRSIEEIKLGVEGWIGLDRMKLIEAYIDAGLSITPLIEGGKCPPKNWHKNYLREQDKNQLLDYFAENPRLNVGCWMPKTLVAVDVDDLEAFYEMTGGETWDTLTGTSGRGVHFYFQHRGTVGSGAIKGQIIDFKTNGSLIVLPPSVHASGRSYEWTNLVEPLEIPQVLQELFDSCTTDKAVNRFASKRRVLTLDTKLVPNERYESLFRFGRSIRFSMDTETVEKKLRKYNEACCQPPLNEERMKRLIRDVKVGKNRDDFRRPCRLCGSPECISGGCAPF